MPASQDEGRVRVWRTDAAGSPYPEASCIGQKPWTGVCFSGGSTRAYAATVGQLRGLAHLGLMPHVTYISAVSGGAWAATPYVFHPAGVDDEQILGPWRDPDRLTLDDLSQLDPSALGYAATAGFGQMLAESHADRSISPGDVWSRTIGRTFLEPYGLFDPHAATGFTLNQETAADYAARNPSARATALTGRPGCPFLLLHAALNWPQDLADDGFKVGFEMSPVAVGSPSLLTLENRDGTTHQVGGGYVETLAFGCAAPTTPPDTEGLVSARLPSRPFTLADAVGASSAFRAAERDVRHYPHVACWPVTGRPDATASIEVLTDGGDVENYGLIPLLRRQVTSVVVFINTLWPLDLGFDPAGWPPIGDRRRRVIDPFLAPLFGSPSRRFPNNRVFPAGDFADLVSSLQQAKREGRPLVSTRTHTVCPNRWWGVEGGWDVRVCWVYNDRVSTWERQLSPPLQAAIAEGQPPAASGPVARFPHYLTRGQNPGRLIELTPLQVNLLSELTCWTVTSARDQLEEILR